MNKQAVKLFLNRRELGICTAVFKEGREDIELCGFLKGNKLMLSSAECNTVAQHLLGLVKKLAYQAQLKGYDESLGIL